MNPKVALTLRKMSAAQGRSPVEIIREAILAYTGKSGGRPRPKGVGAYASGRSDISERSEELMRRAARSRRRWR